MRTIFNGAAVIAAVCMVTGAPAALAATKKAARPAGTGYVATTADGGLQIAMSKDGRQVRSALFAYKANCTDGDTQYTFDSFEAIPVGASRKFAYSYASGAQPSTTTPGATFSYTESFNGTLNKLGTKIVGTARSSFSYANPATGESYTCDSGTVPFKAYD